MLSVGDPVTALRDRRARVDIFCLLLGSRPIGSSIRRPAWTTPHTTRDVLFSTLAIGELRDSSWCARSFFATTRAPTCRGPAGHDPRPQFSADAAQVVM